MGSARYNFPVCKARGEPFIYFNSAASKYITSPHLEVRETTDMVFFVPSNISADPKVIAKHTGGCEVVVRVLYEKRTVREGDVFKLYRLRNGTLAIKKREYLARKETRHDA